MLQVFVYGTHGRKCYVILRGLVRILCPAEDENGVFHFRPHGDLGPGDVGWRNNRLCKDPARNNNTLVFPFGLVLPAVNSRSVLLSFER